VRYSKRPTNQPKTCCMGARLVAPRCVRLTGAHSPASHGRISLFFPALLFPVRKQKEKRYSRHRPGRDNSRSGVSIRPDLSTTHIHALHRHMGHDTRVAHASVPATLRWFERRGGCPMCACSVESSACACDRRKGAPINAGRPPQIQDGFAIDRSDAAAGRASKVAEASRTASPRRSAS
jgi:hypothetical protein